MIVAAVPFKRLKEAKSRLSATLPPQSRTELALDLLRRTVDALRATNRIARVALVTPEVTVAHHLQMHRIEDRGELNASLQGAVEWAEGLGAASLLVVPADLPYVTPVSLERALDGCHGAPEMRIAPTQRGGTGLLLLSPPNVCPLCFGPDSYAKHIGAATSRDIEVVSIRDPAFRDLDTAEDLGKGLSASERTG